MCPGRRSKLSYFDRVSLTFRDIRAGRIGAFVPLDAYDPGPDDAFALQVIVQSAEGPSRRVGIANFDADGQLIEILGLDDLADPPAQSRRARS